MEGILEGNDGEDALPKNPLDTNADVLPSKRVKAPKEVEPVQDEKISKRKKRKLEQLAAKRAGQEMRSEVLSALKTVKLDKDKAALLQASQSTRTSKREKIELAKQREALGLPLTDEQRKLIGQIPKVQKQNDQDVASAPSSSSIGGLQPKPIPVLVPQPKQVQQEPTEAASVKEEAAAAAYAAAKAALAARAAAEAAQEAERKRLEEQAKLSPQPLQRVLVQRTEVIEAQREKLPAVMMEQEIIEMALGTDVMLISGETGCGKSTQVPQFLYEAGFCNGGEQLIAVTQPRRVAAISVSQRVGEELNDISKVGYQVRYDKSHISKDTSIKFMTDGILLREVQADFLCKKYSAIIIDEAHERGVNCDILIGLLSRAVQRRRKDFEAAIAAGLFEKAKQGGLTGVMLPPPPLKLIIMSATLRVCDFTENQTLFPKPPPVLRIEARTFPVTVHFARRTEDDYIKAARKTVMKIHKQLPPGTILVFVTGRQEVHRLCKLINDSQKVRKKRDDAGEEVDDDEEEEEESEEEVPAGDLEASDDEGGDFEDDLDPEEAKKRREARAKLEEEKEQQKRSREGEKKKKQEEARLEDGTAKCDGEADEAQEEDKGKSDDEVEEPAKASKKKKGRKGKQLKAKKGQQTEAAEPAASAEGEEAEDGTSVKRKSAEGSKKRPKKKKAKTNQAPGADTADGAEVEEELDVDFGMGEEEDVVVLDPEVEQDKKDQAEAHAKKVKMARLDKTRTAGGVFKGVGFAEGRLRAMPLYAQLSSSQQLAPFESPPEGERVVVVATNVAETSVTLPNVRYVVDTGHEKRRQYRASSGISAFAVDRISKASADQRAGRAGRLGPGHTYRLYSAAAYEFHFKQFPPIPILHTPMDPVLLLLAFLGVPRLDVFPWPTPPSSESVAAGIKRLRSLGAIEEGDGRDAILSAQTLSKSAVRCTKLGFRLAALPVAPRYGKILLSAVSASQDVGAAIVGHACAIVAALSVGNLTALESLASTLQEEEEEAALKAQSGKAENELARAQREERQRKLEGQKKNEGPRWSTLRDDAEGLLWLMGGYAWATRSGDDAAETFCKTNRVNHRNISEAHSLMQQLAELLKRRLALDAAGIDLELPLQLAPPSTVQALKLRECIVDGLMDRIAVNCPDHGPYAYLCPDVGRETPVYIHNSSNVHRHRPRPTVLVYNDVIATTKVCMRDCVAVDPTLLARRATAGDCPLLEIGDFLPLPAPRYLKEQDAVMAFCSPVYTPLSYKLPTIEIVVPSHMIYRCKVFAKALLEGEVLERFPPPGARLMASPSLVLHAPTNPRVATLVGQLWDKKVGTRKELLQIWAEEPRFLLEGLLKWLPASLHDDICLQWPPVTGRGR